MCVAELDFLKMGKMGEQWAKISFFEFIEKIGHYFFLNLVCDKSLCHMSYSCTNPIFGKNLIPEKWGENALGQSDCRIFKSNIFLEQNDEMT